MVLNSIKCPVKLGFKQCKTDYALFINKNQEDTTVVLAYVDALLIKKNHINKIIYLSTV